MAQNIVDVEISKTAVSYLYGRKGIKEKDALHIACAVNAGCDVFFTTDKKLIRTPIPEIKTMNPIDYILKGATT